MKFAGPQRLAQRVGQQVKLSCDLPYFQSFIEKSLHFPEHCRGQYYRTTTSGRLKKSRDAFLPVQLHVALDADRADPECLADLGLFGAAGDIKLAGNHAEGAAVINIVHKYRHIAIKIGEAITLTFVAKLVVDQGHALVKNRQLELRHGGTSPGYRNLIWQEIPVPYQNPAASASPLC